MVLSPTERALRALVKDYQSLNASTCAELSHTPSPLEFHRFVATNRPVVLRGQGKRDRVRALERWSDRYLEEKMAGKEVAISVSPDGNADSVVDGVFAEPATVRMTLSDLFSRLAAEQALADPSSSSEPVYYLQSQNGNLADEYLPLLEDVGRDGPAWAREAFGEAPEVANIWIGGGRSKTSLHKDPYENLYLVIRGSKTFTLLPPSEAYCVHEQLYPHATYSFSPRPPQDPSSSSGSGGGGTFTLVRTTPELLVPWIPLDPTLPPPPPPHDDDDDDGAAKKEYYPRYALARPMTVTLQAGDMLYLPALWYHHVAQAPGWGPDAGGDGSEGEREGEGEGEGKGVKAAIAVNWWTDMKYEGAGYSVARFVRRLVLSLEGREEEEGEGEGEGEA
ncbi:hypothetical protein JCM1840_007655 [Sporobolomyces johnsonii]